MQENEQKKAGIKNMHFMNEFNADRTPFIISFAWLFIEAIIPALLVWLLMGKEFNFSFYNQLANPKSLWVVLACLLVIFWSIFSTTIIFILKGHRSDNFTFALITSVVLTSFIYNGLWLGSTPVEWFLKIILAVVGLFLSAVLGTMLTAFARNKENKIRENHQIMFEAFKNNEPIPNKQLLKMRRYEAKLTKKELDQKELLAFQSELKQKLDQEILIKEELRKKEQLQREQILEELEKQKAEKKNKKNTK
ncbi:hypothetical protein SSABA_v1c05570 [Spiroplasma sabaudiense Ar-1343]|uniref:Transmembrane protein n=1 Tax=Spiroplasma sabaudiense Ar-1343 TaxID=1276257 RepID=W6AAC4_9MOLU|nr:hypothetical protein [Spiroplasma sabaudiense]AHI53961.1 hypothetical protein SSABA_v1c05570 [Spiroplasma sabaudiense Ar-1343]